MKKILMISAAAVAALAVFSSCSETEYITEQADNLRPSCAIVTPVSGTVIEKGQTLNITAEADDGDGYITEVRFYIQGDLAASDKDSPYSLGFDTAGLASGSYQITAEALDNDGGRTSDSLEVFVNSFPECSIFFPPQNSYYFTGDDVEIKVLASDDENSKHVSSVTFRADGNFISQDTDYPYSAVWTMTQGTHIITAEVTDNAGSVYTDSIQVHQEYAVNFKDPVFEQVIRRDFSRPEGDLYASYFSGVTLYSASSEGITDISGIESFRSIKYLNLNSNLISDITPLSGLTMLEELHLSNNDITDISPLRGLTKLKVLNLSQNNITGIEVLKEFKDLYYLQLAYCGLDDVSALSSLTDLTHLSLQFNSISDISPLSSLTKLTDLSIFDNDIEDITALAGMTSMWSLHIRNNQISDLSALKYLNEIEYLYMENNRITDIYPLIFNEGLDLGDMVALNNNDLDSLSINLYIPILTDRGVSVSW